MTDQKTSNGDSASINADIAGEVMGRMEDSLGRIEDKLDVQGEKLDRHIQNNPGKEDSE